ncbi:hypothetical protein Pcinc_041729 [Petrolisthes cinctipes]|uniref:Uncharacterized protein n=1 Tax=Petrolisthes cinctipes TaxID=88211 RepID=A0AAE1BIW8_PETCI|nr:hypothetical protein Pcinc_041729 [Petrolisthes cinctipes]
MDSPSSHTQATAHLTCHTPVRKPHHIYYFQDHNEADAGTDEDKGRQHDVSGAARSRSEVPFVCWRLSPIHPRLPVTWLSILDDGCWVTGARTGLSLELALAGKDCL